MLTGRQRAFAAFRRSGGVELQPGPGWSLSPSGQPIRRVENRAAAPRREPPRRPAAQGRKGRLAAISDAADRGYAKWLQGCGPVDETSADSRILGVLAKTSARLNAAILALLDVGDIVDELAKANAAIADLTKRLERLEQISDETDRAARAIAMLKASRQ